LDDKDYILSCSKKEGFGYSIAEGMSKGLIPVIHRFYGADDIWDLNVWSTVDQAVKIILDNQGTTFTRGHARDYIEEKGYTTNKMMERFNEVINS
jgi:hypothetical protein